MPFVLETLRAEYRRRFGPSVRFTDKCGQFRIGDWVRFDCQSTKEGGRIIATYKVGQVADLLERDDVAGRICELIIVVPEVPDLDGRIAVPSKLYRRPVHSATRHGGPGHAAEQ